MDIEEQESDEQTVRDKAYRFQIEEIQMLRRLVKEGLEGYVEMLRKKDSDFALERQFFLNQANLNEQVKEDLRENIRRLETELEDEKKLGFEMFV